MIAATLPALPALLGVALLTAVAVVVLAIAGVPERRGPVVAIARALLQLAVVGLVLAAVIRDGLLVGAAVLVMFAVAAATATRRLGWSARHLAAVAGSMAAGVLTTLLIVFATGAVQLAPRYVLAVGGIVVGNAMAITILTARRFLEAADEHWDEVEGWLALGASPREATRALGRGAIHSALVPSLDQTRTTGLVTLPGAFVGAVFGGLSPLDAGRFQLVVLAAILAAGSISAVLVVRLLGALTRRPVR